MATLKKQNKIDRPEFKDNVTRLIISYNDLKRDREELLSRIDSLEKEVAHYSNTSKEWRDKYEALLLAKTIEASKEEVDHVRKRLSKLEQEIEYCITLLIK